MATARVQNGNSRRKKQLSRDRPMAEVEDKAISEEEEIKEEEKKVEEETKLRPGHRKQPDILCGCPQKCGDRIPVEVKQRLYADFWKLGDHQRQNLWLQDNIEMGSVYKRLWCADSGAGGRLQRRVSCKYRVPIAQTSSTTLSQLNNQSSGPIVEVCQKAFMNLYGVSEKRIRIQRERVVSRLRSDMAGGELVLEMVTTSLTDPLLIDRVDLFFRNQLWKPEYMADASDPTATTTDATALSNNTSISFSTEIIPTEIATSPSNESTAGAT